MSDSRVITTEFVYYAPKTMDEALSLMAEHEAAPLAGGTDLLNNIKTNGFAPKAILYLMDCEECNVIRLEKTGKGESQCVIGAAARLRDIERDPEIIRNYPSLKEAVNVIGGTQIRNMATLTGNICNASPGADTPPVLIVLGAEAEISRMGSNGRESRWVKVEEVFAGPKKTILGKDELLTQVRIPLPAKNSGQSFRRLARVRLDIAKINSAVYLERDGGTISEVRVCMGSVAPTPVRTPSVEKVLKGKTFSDTLVEEAAAAVLKDINPISDVRSTAEYRKEVAPILVREALEEAWERSGGKK